MEKIAMAPEEDEVVEEKDESEFDTLWQIRAVREAVIKNLEIRIKRDDDKVSKTQTKLTEIFKEVWFKNLGGLRVTTESYIESTTDLQVSHLSMIQELRAYLKDLNAWANDIEKKGEDIVTLQNLNNNLSLQLKDIENKYREALEKIAELEGVPAPVPKKDSSKKKKHREEDDSEEEN